MSIILSKKLKLSRPNVYMHWCPGCKSAHFIYTCVQEGKGSVWSFNGNVKLPTFSPSIHITYTEPSCTDEEAIDIVRRREHGEKVIVPGTRVTVCHYHLQEGKLIYCSDSPHVLSGQSVDLPDFPQVKYHE